jgi:hypothetical protein
MMGGACGEILALLPHANGERIMLKWNEGAYYAANEEVRLIKNQQQNDDFCRALRSALYARTESCAEGVSTEPGTKKPILNYQRPD